MKLHEIVQIEGKWFRPVSWVGTGRAFTTKGGFTNSVPSRNGGELYMTCHADDLAGDWEFVDPDFVNSELSVLMKRNFCRGSESGY